jgi:hypothetical protein
MITDHLIEILIRDSIFQSVLKFEMFTSCNRLSYSILVMEISSISR